MPVLTRATLTPPIRFPHMRKRRREGADISPTQTHAIPTPRDAGHRKGGRGQHRSGSDVRCAPRDATGSKCTGHFDTASFTRHDADHGSFATIYVEYGSSQGPVFTRVTPGTHARRAVAATACLLLHPHTCYPPAHCSPGYRRQHQATLPSMPVATPSAAPIEDPWRAARGTRQIARLAIGDNRPHSLRYLSPQTSAAPIEDPRRAARGRRPARRSSGHGSSLV
ncbi:MAG: hypothetical protein WDW36_010191 [Sanguina aurantia]